MNYTNLPDDCDFTTKFDTFTIGYCPDIRSWFISDERFFFYVYPDEFRTKEEAEKYFEKNATIFGAIEYQILREANQSMKEDFICLELEENKHRKFEIDRTWLKDSVKVVENPESVAKIQNRRKYEGF